jgi:ribose/xylose/arabinose/galactoside ABC-type transport system permease subunit
MPEKKKNPFIKKSNLHRYVLLGILLVVVIVLTSINDRFLRPANIMFILRQSSFVIMTGCAVTLLMVAGDLDLSVGSTLALSGVAFAFFARAGLPIPLAVVLAVSAGLVVGLLNGIMVVRLKITAFIATLGTMYAARGLTYIISDGLVIRDELPDSFGFLGQEYLGPVPISLLVLTIVVAVFLILEKKSLLGKYSIAVGGNRMAAMLSGINAGAVTMILYAIVGTTAGLSGTMMASRLGVGDPNIGIGFEFAVIIAVILGGTSLAGGEGTIVGTIIGALIVGALGSGLKLLNVFTFYQEVMLGIVLVLAVILGTKLKADFGKKKLRRAESQ